MAENWVMTAETKSLGASPPAVPDAAQNKDVEEERSNKMRIFFSSIITEDIWFISSQQVFTVSLPFLLSAIVQVNWGFLSTKFHPKSDDNDSWEEGSQGL